MSTFLSSKYIFLSLYGVLKIFISYLTHFPVKQEDSNGIKSLKLGKKF
ncbi:hypothetical protein MmTuc01_1105 [Methanosarcina mazei Tuc01]|uniref:Uncharacterized protein n=1 Tax=Methanosarcina mazei Tuc01 TaxID=1236903 RepID=M1P7W3_METMZ|nr:hypothetical protein MmTuc01_1105 [Methanosarcina mazei Tuc01]